ncbi:MAG: aminopeptidase P family protein [Candidatus Heimdallarchaeota archaeon]|nr:aminopeptidase P family protein [Candidatus Heimdallarchaeota archaeon]
MKEKIKRIQSVLKNHGVDGWIVFCHHSYDIHQRYLLERWFSSPTLTLIPQTGKPTVITSGMEAMMVDDSNYEVVPYKKGDELKDSIKTLLNSFSPASKMAINIVEEDEVFSNFSYDILTSGTHKALTKINPQLNYISAKDLIFDIRAVKTKKEIENHRISAQLAEELMEEIVEPQIKPGVTEKEIAALIEYEANRRGGIAFEAIVASGAHAAIPHHKAGQKKIESQQVLLIDYGVAYEGSNSDITHTYWIGNNPPENVLHVYEAVDQAKEAAYSKIRAGVQAEEVEQAVRDKFVEYGYDPEKFYIHSTGHPIGIETHDIGIGIRKGTPDNPSRALLENSVITVEPGLYFPDEFGIRLEDDCVVTKEGSVRLSNTPKEMKCL